MLCGCGDARARAAAALDFLCGNTQATAGFLLLARAGALGVAASSTQQAVPAGLVERAMSFWLRESEVESIESQTRTLELSQLRDANLTESVTLKLPNGESFEPHLLGIYRESRWVPVGVALLKVTPGQTLLPLRRAHIDALCNAFLDSADVAVGSHAPRSDA